MIYIDQEEYWPKDRSLGARILFIRNCASIVGLLKTLLCILHCIRGEGPSHPLTICSVEAMPRVGFVYSYNMNKHSYSTLR